MKINVERGAFLKALNHVQSVVERRNTIPILSNVLIEAAKGQAIADLRGEVAQLAIGAAEVVVKRNLDQATQTQLIEDYINQVNAR